MKQERFRELDKHFMKIVEADFEAGYRIGAAVDDRFSRFRRAAYLGNTTILNEMQARLRDYVVKFFEAEQRFSGAAMPTSTIQGLGAGIINYVRLIVGFHREGEKDHEGCDLPECACHIPGELCCKESRDGLV